MSTLSSENDLLCPPAVPALQHRGPEPLNVNALFWVYRGHARVVLEEGKEYRLCGGDMAWIPAGTRMAAATGGFPGALPVPLRVETEMAGAISGLFDGGAVVRSVGSVAQDVLIREFGLYTTPLRSSWDADLGKLLQCSQDLPPLPVSVAARAVAEALVERPSLPYTVDEWATRVATSSRTLRREFLRETGLTFADWRLEYRLCTAVDLLHSDCDMGIVSSRAGFETVSGFSRAFRRRFGISPREAAGSASLACNPSRLEKVTSGPSYTEFRKNSRHALVWAYRGTGTLEAAGRRLRVVQGDVVFIPVGTEHRVSMDHGSVLLALGGTIPGASGAENVDLPVRAHFPPAWEDFLLSCSVASRTRLRPDGYREQNVFDLFWRQVWQERALAVPMPVAPDALSVAKSFLQLLGTGREPATTDLSAAVRLEFLADTGLHYYQWQRAARMRMAREMLAEGSAPSLVGRRAGYSKLSSFSRAFRDFHGVSPRQWTEIAGYCG